MRTVLAILAALALPGAAEAGTTHFGSDLTAPANTIEAHPVDSAFWAKALPGGLRVRAPARGKVSTIKLKGSIVRHDGATPVTLVHFQILHPTSNGKVQVKLTSGNFHVPVGGDPNRISTYHPVNLCAKQGDYVSFTDVGGYKPPHYPHGTPFRVFSSVPDAVTNFFSKAGGTNNGKSFKGAPHQGEELLMRMTLLTGQDAGYCQNH